MIDPRNTLMLNTALVCGAIALAVGGVGGAAGTSLYYRAELARTEAAAATAQTLAVEAQIRRTGEAQALADALSSKLASTEQALSNTAQEALREIPRVTTGRPCLGPGAVRLLNPTRGAGAGTVPPPAGPLAAEDGPVASDTDIATWIAGAQGQYETCRARLGALIDFEEGSPQ